MLQRPHFLNGRHVLFALSTLCLALVVLVGCNSGSTAKKPTPTPTHTPATRTAFILPAGFTTYKTTTFYVAHPNNWNQQNPANGTGIQYAGPNGQTFVVASLGKAPGTPQAFDTAFCSPTGFGGTASGAPKTVTINGVHWVQLLCTDAKTDKTAMVEAVVHNNQFYYMVYTSPTASFQTNRSQYFTPMEQSFTFVG
jgi:hypothetical protein